MATILDFFVDSCNALVSHKTVGYLNQKKTLKVSVLDDLYNWSFILLQPDIRFFYISVLVDTLTTFHSMVMAGASAGASCKESP